MSARYYKDREGCSSTFQTERKSTMAVSKPLLLLDNASMLALLHQGCFRLQEISFEEVKAIIEMHGSREVVRCFSNAEIEQLQLRTRGEHGGGPGRHCVPPLCHAVGDAAQYPHGVRQ